MSSNNPAEKSKSGRSATSCLECQRRKQKCSREWPCNHCQTRKVPHLCQFASRKVPTPESDSSTVPVKLSKKRKEDSFESDTSALADDPNHDLSDGFAKLGYMPSHDVFKTLARSKGDSPGGRAENVQAGQPEEIEAALKIILPKPYTDVLVQNYLDRANFQYYPVFPEQLRGQSAKWWEARATGQRLSPELTCLLIRVCAVSTQYLEESLRQRLEFELGEKAQAMTDRFHAAAQKLSASVPRGQGGIVQVQQLFLEAAWYKSEASMVDAWHALSVAIREAQEIGMHKPLDCLPNFERELRKRLWCILWTWDWQMSTLLSRPLLIDQDDHKLEIPGGRLENIDDAEVPHPLRSVALQAELGLHVSHLFQKLGTNNSIELVLEIEDALEKWMATFPSALRDHRPDTRWDQKYPNVPFMRAQLNVIAYCYLLAPLKPYLLGTAGPEVMSTQIGTDLRLKGVNTCLDLLNASEKFYELIFPASIKYFFIIFFIFDAATIMCSAIVHDVGYNLPKRSQCIRSLRTAQELMDGVVHISESARISAQLLRKLVTTLPLTEPERQTLAVGPAASASASASASSRRVKTRLSPSPDDASGSAPGRVPDYALSNVGYSSLISSARTSSIPSTVGSTPAYEPAYHHPHDVPFIAPVAITAAAAAAAAAAPPPAMTAREAADWPFVNYTGPTAAAAAAAAATGPPQPRSLATTLQPGDPLTGTYLEPLWDWDHLNMDLSGYHMPPYTSGI